MKIRVSATRMELLKLRRRLALAVRGHRLLKDKQDELVRQFMIRQEEYRRELNTLERALERAGDAYALLRGSIPGPSLHLACESGTPAPGVQAGRLRVVNLMVPSYSMPALSPSPLYGLLEGAGPAENAVEAYSDLVGLLVRKAELEGAMLAILREIEVTRRRVNALEYKLIPSLRETIAGITSKLSELELSALTRLMRVKEIIEQGPSSRSAAG